MCSWQWLSLTLWVTTWQSFALQTYSQINDIVPQRPHDLKKKKPFSISTCVILLICSLCMKLSDAERDSPIGREYGIGEFWKKDEMFALHIKFLF